MNTTTKTTYQMLTIEVEHAKKAILPREALYEAYGMIKMSRMLEAITHDEYMALNHACVADGINNPKYF